MEASGGVVDGEDPEPDEIGTGILAEAREEETPRVQGETGHSPPAPRAVPDLEQQPVDRLHVDVGVEQPPRAVPPDRDDDLRVDLLQLDVQLPLVPADVLGGDVLDLGRAPPGPFLDQICYEQVLT